MNDPKANFEKYSKFPILHIEVKSNSLFEISDKHQRQLSCLSKATKYGNNGGVVLISYYLNFWVKKEVIFLYVRLIALQPI